MQQECNQPAPCSPGNNLRDFSRACLLRKWEVASHGVTREQLSKVRPEQGGGISQEKSSQAEGIANAKAKRLD